MPKSTTHSHYANSNLRQYLNPFLNRYNRTLSLYVRVRTINTTEKKIHRIRTDTRIEQYNLLAKHGKSIDGVLN